MNPAFLDSMDATGLSQALHAGQLSCRDLMQATLARIAERNPVHKAIVSLREPEALLAEADAHDALLARGQSKGWLHGIPQAIKDLSATAGIPTTQGSPLLAHVVPREDELMVARIKAAGGIVIGKTNTPEFGLGSHTFNPVFGTTVNAWNPARSAGGSSGGAAVALALRMLAVADGSDFMGSLRNPAGWNHVFGMRPSQGRVPQVPAADAWLAQLGTAGPMARTVRDLARLLDTQAGHDPRAPLSLDDGARFAEALGQAARPVRIAWLGDLDGYLPMDDGVLGCCEEALRRLESLGCAVEPAALGTPPEPVWDAWLVWRRVLVGARIAPLLALSRARERIKPEALWEYEQGQGTGAAQFMAASSRRTAFHQHLLGLFERYDVLALPSAQVWPFDAALRWPATVAGRAMDTYHRWMEVVIYASFAGLPAISVPAGFGAAGLPMGLQLIGRPRDDAGVLRLAAAYEAAAADLLRTAPPA
ncbi:amidase [Pseudorhodoferax sp.]|uniref:amidase n=1 Tax=Pseudorhodoferax sp. TaxID=1993553 RepID=UPI002DD692D1|nr:amidase [Pseudorhodoferax sp.]